MLRRIHLALVATLVATLLGTWSTAGCGGSSACNDACEKVNRLDCNTCNCAACDDVPEACDEYIECIQRADNCLAMWGCTANGACANFVSNNCGL